MFLLVLGLLTTCLPDTGAQKPKWKTRLKAEAPSPLATGKWGQPCEVGQHSPPFPGQSMSVFKPSAVQFDIATSSLTSVGKWPRCSNDWSQWMPRAPRPRHAWWLPGCIYSWRIATRHPILSVHGHRNSFCEEPGKCLSKEIHIEPSPNHRETTQGNIGSHSNLFKAVEYFCMAPDCRKVWNLMAGNSKGQQSRC